MKKIFEWLSIPFVRFMLGLTFIALLLNALIISNQHHDIVHDKHIPRVRY